jgi:hypothetical protein
MLDENGDNIVTENGQYIIFDETHCIWFTSV